MFNIILPKPCEIFAKSLANLQQKFNLTTDPMVIQQIQFWHILTE